MAYDTLRESKPHRAAKEYLKLLDLAAKQSKARVDDVLRTLLEQEGEISATAVELRLAGSEAAAPITAVRVGPVELARFDELFVRPEMLQ